MKGSLIIIGFFILGILAGYYNLLPNFLLAENGTTYALYFLLFFVGVALGADSESWKILRKAQFKIIFVPLSTIVGTLIGIGIVSLFIDSVSLTESLAIGSGMGYYSLSSVFISEVSSSLGVIALLSNILREVITLLFTPIFAKVFGKLAPIACGGATSMDTTLPVITKYVGKEYAVISLFNGIVLTVLVPILVLFFLEL